MKALLTSESIGNGIMQWTCRTCEYQWKIKLGVTPKECPECARTEKAGSGETEVALNPSDWKILTPKLVATPLMHSIRSTGKKRSPRLGVFFSAELLNQLGWKSGQILEMRYRDKTGQFLMCPSQENAGSILVVSDTGRGVWTATVHGPMADAWGTQQRERSPLNVVTITPQALVFEVPKK